MELTEDCAEIHSKWMDLTAMRNELYVQINSIAEKKGLEGYVPIQPHPTIKLGTFRKYWNRIDNDMRFEFINGLKDGGLRLFGKTLEEYVDKRMIGIHGKRHWLDYAKNKLQ